MGQSKPVRKKTSAGYTGHENRGVSNEDAEIGRRVRLLRIERDMSQEALGEKLGVSFQQIQKYEKGINRVTCGRLMEIARVLTTTPHDLMGWNEKLPTIPIDAETYKLAKTFAGLREGLKRPIRLLISSLMEEEA